MMYRLTEHKHGAAEITVKKTDGKTKHSQANTLHSQTETIPHSVPH